MTRERERERQTDRQTDRHRQKQTKDRQKIEFVERWTEIKCVCVCVLVSQEIMPNEEKNYLLYGMLQGANNIFKIYDKKRAFEVDYYICNFILALMESFP